MNIARLQDQVRLTTIGGCLRQARENIGLSQQIVAERLCLKVSTVRDIEEDHVNPNLAATFLRGYIFSYARLVHIPEEDLIPMMAKQALLKTSKVAPMKNFLIDKIRKERDGWLMGVTWFIIFAVVGLTGIWWWQYHQAQQQDIANMVVQSSVKLLQRHNMTSVPLGSNSDNLDRSLVYQPPHIHFNVPPILAEQSSTNVYSSSSNGDADVLSPNSHMLIMNFSNDCWLEVLDAKGKKLYSGTQHNGGKMNLIGQAPYKLKIGAPAAVEIQYQGKLVDLSRFIRARQIARLIL